MILDVLKKLYGHYVETVTTNTVDPEFSQQVESLIDFMENAEVSVQESPLGPGSLVRHSVDGREGVITHIIIGANRSVSYRVNFGLGMTADCEAVELVADNEDDDEGEDGDSPCDCDLCREAHARDSVN